MGIFDNAPDDTNNPGLIGQIVAALGLQPAAPAPVASAAAFTPPPIDPTTGETVQPAAAMPGSQPAPQPNFFQKAAAGLHSIAQGGSIYGATTGQFDDPKSVQRQQLQQQYSALIAGGMTPQQAQLTVLGGADAAKAMVAQQFGPHNAENLGEGWIRDPVSGKVTRAYTPEQNDSFSMVQTGEDGLGKKTFAKMNKATGEMTPIAAAPGADNGGGLGDMNLTGDAYLASMPKSEANIVKMMAEGTQAPPSTFALGKPAWVNRIAAAKNYDPTFDGANWAGRVAGVRDFSAGKSSEMVRSANQTLAHVNSLLDSADALHNGNYPLVNWAENNASAAMGSGAPGAFTTNAHAVAEEMSKVFKGSNMSDSEIRSWEQNLSPNMSPEQQRAQIGKLSELLHGSLDALEEKRLNSIGPMAAAKQGPLIKPAGQAVLQRIDGWLKAGNAPGAASGGTAPTGVKWSVVQ
jgi:hypothetical protein